MFNNTVKNIVSIGLLFSLCAPCSFASAQKMPPNLFVPKNSGGNRTNRQNIGNFNPFLRAMQQAAQMQSDRPQVQPSALEQFWNEHFVNRGLHTLRLYGFEIHSAEEFANYIRNLKQNPVQGFRWLMNFAQRFLEVPFNSKSLVSTRDIIADIYKLNEADSNNILLESIESAGIHQNRAKAFFDKITKK